LAELFQEQDGILPRRLPHLRVDRAEEILDAGLPGPQQIVSEFV
jgi:hypothetical protein